MKIILFCILTLNCFLCIQSVQAQKRKKEKEKLDPSFFLLKEDWSIANSLDEATYFMQLIVENDSLYICRYYNKYGPMVKQESFFDLGFTIPHGRFCWYDKDGNLDSTGIVTKGRKDNYWQYYRGGKTYLSVRYRDGVFTESKDYDANLHTAKDGTKIPLDEKIKADSIAADSLRPVQVEAKYNDGNKAWLSYISKNLETPDRLIDVMGSGRHLVIVSFQVNNTGDVDDVYLFKSCEWSADAEVFRVIKQSPKWQSATQNGKPVIYRQMQSLTFQVEEENHFRK